MLFWTCYDVSISIVMVILFQNFLNSKSMKKFILQAFCVEDIKSDMSCCHYVNKRIKREFQHLVVNKGGWDSSNRRYTSQAFSF